MPAAGIVIGFDEGKELSLSVVRIDEASVLKHFGFVFPIEDCLAALAFEAACGCLSPCGRFRPGVVVGVGLCGHTLKGLGLLKLASEEFAAILTAPVTVENETRLWAA